MPVLHHDQQLRKLQRARWLAWLLVLPGLLLVAFLVPVFAPVQVRMNWEEWTATSWWRPEVPMMPQGVSFERWPQDPRMVTWTLQLGYWRYQVYRSDVLPDRSGSSRWSEREWGIRFAPR